MSDFTFKGGDFHIAMADSRTAALLAATNISLDFAHAPAGQDIAMQSVGNAAAISSGASL